MCTPWLQVQIRSVLFATGLRFAARSSNGHWGFTLGKAWQSDRQQVHGQGLLNGASAVVECGGGYVSLSEAHLSEAFYALFNVRLGSECGDKIVPRQAWGSAPSLDQQRAQQRGGSMGRQHIAVAQADALLWQHAACGGSTERTSRRGATTG